MSNNTKNYRPYLTAAEIEYVIDVLSGITSVELDNKNKTAVLNKFDLLQYKISKGTAAPAYTATPVASTAAEKLGFGNSKKKAAASKIAEYNSLAIIAAEGGCSNADKARGRELELELFDFDSGLFC